MKTLFIPCLYGILFACNLFAQPQYFSRTLDFNGYSEFAYAMVKVSDGFIITGGQTGTQSRIELFVTKVNVYGDTIWSKILKHPYKHYTSGEIRCIAKRQAGGFYVYGSTNDTIGAKADALLYCFNDNGDTLFTRKFGGTQFDVGVSIAESACGDVYALGNTGSKGDTLMDVYLIKLDSLGNVLWERTYGTFNITDQAHTISIDGDHSIYLGTSYINGAISGITNNIPRLIKVDSSGVQKFSRTVITTDVNLHSGSFGFAHLHAPNQIYLFSAPMNSGYISKIYVTLFDSIGSNIFTKEIVGARVLAATADFYSEPDGSLVLCGIGNTVPSWTYDGWDSEEDGGLILKLNPSADSVWARYHIVHPGQFQSLLYAIEPSSFGGYFLAGTYVGGGVQDIWLMSVDSLGCLGPDSCGAEQPIVSLMDIDLPVSEDGMFLYPNPTPDRVYIQIPEAYTQASLPPLVRKANSRLPYDPMRRNHYPFEDATEQHYTPLSDQQVSSRDDMPTSTCSISVYNTEGRCVQQHTLEWASEMQLSLQDLPHGIYYLQVLHVGRLYGKKVIVGR